jgi:hypothetical protein
MAKAILPAGYNNPGIDQPLEIELKELWIAALLAWLLPGAGHVYQGRTGKGLLCTPPAPAKIPGDGSTTANWAWALRRCRRSCSANR